MTKARQKEYALMWATNPNKTLTECYANPSPIKKKIWRAIQTECSLRKGYNLSVLTCNTYAFTVAYEWKSTEGYPMLTIHTPTETVDVNIQDIDKWAYNSRTDEP